MLQKRRLARGTAAVLVTLGVVLALEGTAVASAPPPVRLTSGSAVLTGSLTNSVAFLSIDPAFDHRPVNPPGVPTNPAATTKPAFGPVGQVKRHGEYNCYAPGTAGYQTDCLNPGYENDAGTGWMSHWGWDPYTHSNTRYVWVNDHLTPGSRASAWLQYIVNVMNNQYTSTGSHGPYFLYAQHPGTCAQNRQYVEVCYTNAPDGRSVSYWTVDSLGHFQWAQNFINSSASSNDMYNEYSVIHEFGHTLGYAHDTDCTSVMTYCPTAVGLQYLFYSTNQNADYAGLYTTTHQGN